MKIGVLIVFHESTARPGPFAEEMERIGFESLWAPEHPILPVNPKTPFPQGGPIPDVYAHMSDQFICLGMAAATTSRLKLGTGENPVPEHNPMVAAKQIATLDYFSGGRRSTELARAGCARNRNCSVSIFRGAGPRPPNISRRCVNCGRSRKPLSKDVT